MLIHVDYPPLADELEIVRRTTGVKQPVVSAVVDLKMLNAARRVVRCVPIAEPLLELAVQFVRASRPGDACAPDWLEQRVQFGAGPRAAQALVLTAKARAALAGRPCVSLEDLGRSAVAVLRHRLVLSFESDAEGVTPDDIVSRLVTERLSGSN